MVVVYKPAGSNKLKRVVATRMRLTSNGMIKVRLLDKTEDDLYLSPEQFRKVEFSGQTLH